MTLTPDDLTILRKPFAPNEHEFLRGFTYITEEAISNRLDDVDPSWSLEILNQAIRDNQAIVTVRLTVKGVSRDGVGMAVIMEKGAEPEKSAATDALKRAARLFGIGRYLLGTPEYVKDVTALAKWLNAPSAPQLVPQQRPDRRIPNGKHNTPPTLTSADIEAALKGDNMPWHSYRIEKNQAGNMQIVLKQPDGMEAAKEAVAARGFKIINAGRNWFVVTQPQPA